MARRPGDQRVAAAPHSSTGHAREVSNAHSINYPDHAIIISGCGRDFGRIARSIQRELSALQARIQQPFKNPQLLHEAVTHYSADAAANNKRLAALGACFKPLPETSH